MRPFAILIRICALLATLSAGASAGARAPRGARHRQCRLFVRRSQEPEERRRGHGQGARGGGLRRDGRDRRRPGRDGEGGPRPSAPSSRRKGGVGLFYFSGHGAQISGENYLIPVSVTAADEVKSGSVTATEIVNAMAGAHNGLNIVILDACRTNPFDPNGAHGLSRIDSNASLFVSYATSPGAWRSTAPGTTAPTPNISPSGSPPPISASRTRSSAR